MSSTTPPPPDFPDEEPTSSDLRPTPEVPHFPDEEMTDDAFRLTPPESAHDNPFDHSESTDAGGLGPPVDGDAGSPAPPVEGEGAEASPSLVGIVESLLFAADKPLSLRELGQILGAHDLGPVRAAVAELETHYAERGIQLHGIAGGHQFRTHPRHASWVQKLLAQKPVRLSRAQLETLAICSYRQPITRPEIDDIRGVDSGAALKTLMDRSLVRILGKKEEPGRPLLYGTTREFLDFFSLKDLKDLPTLREFHELSEEHRAQVEALAAQAPEGSLDLGLEEPVAPAPRPMERASLPDLREDTQELEEIDRLITTAAVVEVKLDGDAAAAPVTPPAGEAK